MMMTTQLRLYHMFQLQNTLLWIHLLICQLPKFLLSSLLFLWSTKRLLVIQHVFLVLQANGGRSSMQLNLRLRHHSFGQKMKKRMLKMLNRQTRSLGQNLAPSSRLCTVLSQIAGEMLLCSSITPWLRMGMGNR
jgi:hypothetical protein